MEVREFQVESGKVILGDLITKKSNVTEILENVKRGTWEARVELSDDTPEKRIQKLFMNHYDLGFQDNLFMLKANFQLCVDNGQVGILDEKHFAKCILESKEHNSENIWDVLPFGCIVSFLNKGIYDVFYSVDIDNQIEAIDVVFCTL